MSGYKNPQLLIDFAGLGLRKALENSIQVSFIQTYFGLLLHSVRRKLSSLSSLKYSFSPVAII